MEPENIYALFCIKQSYKIEVPCTLNEKLGKIIDKFYTKIEFQKGKYLFKYKGNPIKII